MLRDTHEAYRRAVEAARNADSDEARSAAEADLISKRHELDDALVAAEEAREDEARLAAAEAREAAAHIVSATAPAKPEWLDRSKVDSFLRNETNNVVFKVPRELRTDMTTADSTGYLKYTIPTDLNAAIDMFEIAESGVLASGPKTLNTAQGNPLDWPTMTTDMSSIIGAEGTAATVTNPVISKVTLNSYRSDGFAVLSDELLRDSGVDLSAVIAEMAGRSLAVAKAGYLANPATGSGSSCPHAIQVHATSALTAGATNDVTLDELKQLYYSVLPQYRQAASWLACSSLTLKIAQKKTDDGAYIWNPSAQANEPDRLFGKPFFEDAYMPAAATTTKSLGFGDTSQAYIVRNVGGREISLSRDFVFTSFEVTVRWAEWFDAQTVDAIAFKYITQAT